MARFFVTGGTGFVGKRVLPRLAAGGHEVTALCRTPAGELGLNQSAPQQLRWVQGDLSEPAGWRSALEGADVVLHLAARTGKASRQVHWRDNFELTKRLIDECRAASVRRFVFASSIVTRFPDPSRYPYAQAKVEAEAMVRASGLSYLILRPTLVFGPGSPSLQSLKTLACAPFVLVFGNGRTQVQPIDVDDLADLIVEAADHPELDGGEFDLGGLETTTMEVLLQSIRKLERGAPGRVLRLPVATAMTGLWASERLFGAALLPVTAGQLSVFRYDSTVEPNRLMTDARSRTKTIGQILQSGLAR